jgi:hypothetical protein
MNIFTIIAATVYLQAPMVSDSLKAPYATVLDEIRSAYPGRPLVLFRDILGQDCIAGCPDPWRGQLTISFVEEMRAEGLVDEFCSYISGDCRTEDGEAVRFPAGAYVMLTDARCEDWTLRIWATVTVAVGSRSALRSYWRYAFKWTSHGWELVAAEHRGDANVD